MVNPKNVHLFGGPYGILSLTPYIISDSHNTQKTEMKKEHGGGVRYCG